MGLQPHDRRHEVAFAGSGGRRHDEVPTDVRQRRIGRGDCLAVLCLQFADLALGVQRDAVAEKHERISAVHVAHLLRCDVHHVREPAGVRELTALDLDGHDALQRVRESGAVVGVDDVHHRLTVEGLVDVRRTAFDAGLDDADVAQIDRAVARRFLDPVLQTLAESHQILIQQDAKGGTGRRPMMISLNR